MTHAVATEKAECADERDNRDADIAAGAREDDDAKVERVSVIPDAIERELKGELGPENGTKGLIGRCVAQLW